MRLTRRARRASVALIAAGSIFALAACGSSSDDNGAGGSTDAVITSFSVQPQNPLIPTNTNEVGGGNIIDLIFAGLVSYKSDGEAENEVAESIESDDNKVWTIKLKSGWKFADGTDVTAKSFVDAWNYGADAKNAQLGAYFFAPIEGTDDEGSILDEGKEMSGLKVVDDLTFTVTLKQPGVEFPDRLGYAAYFPLPESAYDDMEAFGKKPVGNGPYDFVSMQNNVEAVLVPSKTYNGVRKAENGGVTLKFYENGDTAYSDVQGGNLDVLDQVPPSALTGLEDDSTVQSFLEPGSVSQAITIPESLKGFEKGEEGNLRRQAISRAINREEIADKIFDGARIAATDFSSPLMPGFAKDIEGADVLKFDADEAKKLWEQAEAINKFEGSFEIAYNGDGPGNKEWVEAASNQLRNVLGIDAKPKVYPTFAELREDVTDRKIDSAFRTGWQPDYPSIQSYIGPLYSTGGSSNDGDYSNKAFDALMDKAAGTEDDDERYGLYAEAQAILFQDLPAIPLWNQSIAAAAADGVKNVEFNWQNKPELHKITK